jgi:ribosome-binding factor A
MTSDIKGVKKCDVGGHDVGLYTTVKISEPFSGREVNVCQDLHHAAVFINPENPRAAANKKL